jgi:hypothetical protein
MSDKIIGGTEEEPAIFDGDVRDALQEMANFSGRQPGKHIFVIIHADDDVQPTGMLQIMKLDTQAEVAEVLKGRPENGLFAIFCNGKLTDSSDRFFQEEKHMLRGYLN